MVTLTSEQYHSIISAMQTGGEGFRANPRCAAALMVEANLGMRIGDVLRLRLSDIVRDGGRYRLNVVEEKTGKARRFSVPAEVYDFLRQYAERNNIPDTDPLFPVCEYAVQKHLKKVCDYLGYENISTHSFRKWYATEIYKATGNDLLLVQRLLQHSSPSITRRYIGISDERMEQAIANHVNIISA